LMDKRGICASSGSACLTDSDEPSHVIKAMKPESESARQMIRLSLGIETEQKEVEQAMFLILQTTKLLSENS
jgi:cysteine desulfurase